MKDNNLISNYADNLQVQRIQQQEDMALKQFQNIDNNDLKQKASKIQALVRGVKFRSKELPNIIEKKLKEDKLMDIANDVVSQINRQKQIANVNDLTNKLNASSFANDMLNDIFATTINTIPENNYNLRSKGPVEETKATNKTKRKYKKLSPEQKQELEKLKNELKTLEKQSQEAIAKQEERKIMDTANDVVSQINKERQIEKATNAYFTLEGVFQRNRQQRIYNAKKQQQELYKSFKTFNAFIKRKEAQRNYINIKHRSFHEKLGMIYQNIGNLLQNIQVEYKKIFIGEIPVEIIDKRKDLDKKLNEDLDFAKEILEILNTKFNEDITVHLYNIDKFKKEIIQRELGQYGQARASVLQREEAKMIAELKSKK